MRKPIHYAIATALLALMAMGACTDEHIGYDPAPGANTDEPEPEVLVTAEAMKYVDNPRIAKETNYWIFSSNVEVPEDYESTEYERGLMVRTSEDLLNFGFSGYILSEVIDTWAADALKALDPSIEENSLRVTYPSIGKAGNEWRLYYTVNAGMDDAGQAASVIGYATSPSLEDQQWTDRGKVMESVSGGANGVAAAPAFYTSVDGSRHFLAYGHRTGVWTTELDPATGLPTGTPVFIGSTQGNFTGAPTVHIHNNHYYMFYSYGTAPSYTVFTSCSTDPMGPFVQYADAADVALNWPENKILAPYLFMGSRWGGFESISVLNDGTQDFIATYTYANNNADNSPDLQIRKLDWINCAAGFDYPCISTDPWSGELDPVEASDLVGTYGWCSIWLQVDGGNNSGVAELVYLYEGGSAGSNFNDTEGNWSYNSSTNVVTINALWWGETIYVVPSRVVDTDDGEENITLSGYNDDFYQHMGVWAKKHR